MSKEVQILPKKDERGVNKAPQVESEKKAQEFLTLKSNDDQ